MELEDRRAVQDLTPHEDLAPGDVVEDGDGDLILVLDMGQGAVLVGSDTATVGGSLPLEDLGPVRRLRTKLVILATALLVLVGGCTVAQDNGFMTACVPEDMGPVLLGEDALAAGCDAEIVWPSTPLRVRLEGLGSGELDRAIDRWENRRPLSSQDLFERVGAGDAEVYVATGLAPEPGSLDALGDVRFTVSGSDGLWAIVHTYNTPSSAQLECVLFHELGHVLGLAHDDFGPMQPAGCDLECDPADPECTDDLPALVDARVTDKDHRRLLERY